MPSGINSFAVLPIASIAITLFSVPKQVRALKTVGMPLPGLPAVMISQSLILTILMAAIGAAVAPRIDLKVVEWHNGLASDLVLVLVAGVVGGVITTFVLLAYYYGVLRPRIPRGEAIFGERLRLEMGMMVRVLHGGIVEEVQFRWGFMSLIAWIGLLIAPGWRTLIGWIAVLLSALVFALYHLAGVRQLGTIQTRTSKWGNLFLNLWGGIIFGAAYLQYGLLAAIIVHTLAHTIWHPIEIWVHRRLKSSAVI